MAGATMTFTYDDLGSIRKVICDWLADDSTGAVSGTTKKITGSLIKGLTNPDANAPTDDYDIVITDEESFNVLTGADDDLVDRDTSTTEEVYFFVLDHAGTPLAQSIHPVVADKLTVAVTNAGNANQGRLILYYRAA